MRLSAFAALFASAALIVPAVEARPRPPAANFVGTATTTTATTAPPAPPPVVVIPPSLYNAGAAAGNLSLITQSTPAPLKVITSTPPKTP